MLEIQLLTTQKYQSLMAFHVIHTSTVFRVHTYLETHFPFQYSAAFKPLHIKMLNNCCECHVTWIF